MFLLYSIYLRVYLFFTGFFQTKETYRTYYKPKAVKAIKNNKKPDWVVSKVIYLKAMMPQVSGYKIADIFNRQFSPRETVSKTYVYNIIRKHKYSILTERKNIKNKKPYQVKINKIWAIDLTGKHDASKQNKHIFAIIDHGSRFNIVLKHIKDKSSKRLLFELYKAVKEHGKPGFIRTDNDVVFKSIIFKLGLKFMGINQQLTDIGCPWQNGRVERFFGTLKEKLNLVLIKNSGHLDWHLTDFRFWYNHVRTHMNLEGSTPIEVWLNKDIKPEAEFYSAWDGLLTGYLHPLDG